MWQATYSLCLMLITLAPSQEPAKPAAEPKLTIEDLEFLVGDWSGSLEYLNYGDNKTRVKLVTVMNGAKVGDTISYQFTYTEPNGKVVQGDRITIKLAKDGRELSFDGELWVVKSKKIDRAASTYEFVIQRLDADDNKPAELRKIFAFTKGELSIRKEILSDPPLLRNEYRMTKNK